jgi:HD-GYP domain-containing protein (c-di-GMP phosphodiesterase class II)
MSSCRWAERFPRIENLVAVQVPLRSPASWLIALNKDSTLPAIEPDANRGSSGAATSPGAGFRRSDAVLLSPLAALLAVHFRATRRQQQFTQLLIGLTRPLAVAVDLHDALLPGHSERVARIAVELGRELGLDEHELRDLYIGGLLHDIGKLRIASDVLQKREPLTPGELGQIREHPTLGWRMLADLQPIAHLLPAVLHHHERYDGTGYPQGLKGEGIPLLARIIAVAESYDAMATPGLPHPDGGGERVEEALVRGAGSQWDSRVVAAFFRCRDRIREQMQRGALGSSRSLPVQAGEGPGDLPNLGDQPPGEPTLAAH